MNNILLWTLIVSASIIFGILDHISSRNSEGSIRHILDVWRHTVNYFLTAILIYFFLKVRLPKVSSDANLSGSDFIVGFAIIIGIFGWWPYVIKNLTEGINAIISRALGK